MFLKNSIAGFVVWLKKYMISIGSSYMHIIALHCPKTTNYSFAFPLCKLGPHLTLAPRMNRDFILSVSLDGYLSSFNESFESIKHRG
jgi:hypothetical protein